MAEKKRKKESKKKDRSAVPPEKEPGQSGLDKSDDQPDYGGLPNRDLKKNLGCG
jgi:hypothetical protein